ncbi:MAG: hypothetical protein WAZ76_15045 [Blautia wexlerae]
MLDERIYESYIGILKEEMVPAMGCTEPIALAYGAARASSNPFTVSIV